MLDFFTFLCKKMDSQYTLWLVLIFGSWILLFYLVVLVLYVDARIKEIKHDDMV
jgi:hypothetical protein